MKEIDDITYNKLEELGLINSDWTRMTNVGTSNYSDHVIQPWSIWLDWNLNPFDADIIKRVLRTKKDTHRAEDYRKIIHICEERIRQLKVEDTQKGVTITFDNTNNYSKDIPKKA